MPELPDLLYIRKHLRKEVVGRKIVDAAVKQPVVIRMGVDTRFERAIVHQQISSVDFHGPFIRFELSGSLDLILNLMLMGRLQHRMPLQKAEGHVCFSISLDDGSVLNLCDKQKMAKAYVVPHGEYDLIPKYNNQGVDILSTSFTPDLFGQLAKKHSRKQVRVFINDQTILSAIGNAYADEILFDARIHPKTFVARLSPEEIETLYHSIRSVMAWGIEKVEGAQEPIHVKIRDHTKVRWRRGEPCPRCGTSIRREGVHGHDVFFCPACQPASRRLFIDWKNT